MRFSTVFTAGLWASSALAAAIPSGGQNGHSLKRRDLDEDDFARIAAASCGGAAAKRLMARAEDVDLDDAKDAKPDTDLTTGGLSTCVGMAVTGVAKPDTTPSTHFLAHLMMTDNADDVFDKLKGLVDDNSDDLTDLKSYITIAALTKENVRSIMEEDAEGEEIEDDDVEGFMEYLQEQYDDLKEKLADLAPIAGTGSHDPSTTNTMESLGDGTVTLNGSSL